MTTRVRHILENKKRETIQCGKGKMELKQNKKMKKKVLNEEQKRRVIYGEGQQTLLKSCETYYRSFLKCTYYKSS